MPSGVYQRKLKRLVDRLLAKTKKTDSCWLWLGSMNSFGHGQIMVWSDGRKRLEMAHRVSYKEHVGQIPDGLCVLHRCDKPNCINPDHLFLGTKADNSRDMVSKNRSRRGHELPQTKLTADEVIRIRAATSESQASLAKRFGISQCHVSMIRRRLKRVYD